jgi:hypothetical protein
MFVFAASTVYGKKSPAQADSINPKNLLHGTWIIDTTVIKQTVDSVSTTKSYLAGDTAVTFVRRPLQIIISTDEIEFVYPDMTESGTYTLENEKLSVGFPTHGAEYKYFLIKPDKLHLYYSVKYVIDGEHQAEEQCIFKSSTVSNE